ncbi:MAG: DUF4160 domain-containing protein [Bacteroidetes bacterium]|nr:DUF4160 domain-containing protein [Bacteroidota bacterium]
MPTVLLVNGYRFFFYMNELLPVHIHVSKGGSHAKFNLIPEIELVLNRGFKVKELKEVVTLIIEHYDFLIKKWNETFN